MARISYRVSKAGADKWSVARDDAASGMTYFTQEAAYEAAFGEAGGDLRSGHDIVIEVEAATERSGARDRGGEPIAGDGFS